MLFGEFFEIQERKKDGFLVIIATIIMKAGLV